MNIAERKVTTEQSYTYDKSDVLVSSSKSNVSTRIIPDTIFEPVYHYFAKNSNLDNSNFFENDKTNISNVDFTPYMQELQQKIQRNWKPPKGEESRRVILLFTIARDGRLLSVKVSKSSGLKSADEAAISAVWLTAPFRTLPNNYSAQSVDIQFTFDYNVFDSKNQ